jgi:hypothetical protein
MSEGTKRRVVIGVVLFVLAVFAWYSISTLPKKQTQTEDPLLLSPAQGPVLSSQVRGAVGPVAAEVARQEGSSSVVSIPTLEEIKQSIEDQDQKRKTMEELMTARNKKRDEVMAAITAEESSSVSQETASDQTQTSLSQTSGAGQGQESQDNSKARRSVQGTAPAQTLPLLSPAARAERNKELRDGIKAHLYFPH